MDWKAVYPQVDVTTLLPFERVVLEARHANLLFRTQLLSFYENNAAARAIELVKCKSDYIWWHNRWVWTYDPRLNAFGLSGDVPFLLFPKQEELALWIMERIKAREDGLVEKSRAQGATNVFSAISVWKFLTESGISVAVGSRKEELVDSRDNPDSILEKCRFIIDHLPDWMLSGLGTKVDSKLCQITNKGINSVIKGEAGANIGRGGRNSFYWVDEHAFLQHAAATEAALATNAPTVFRITTLNDIGTEFDKLRDSGMPIFFMHWKDNPFCGEDWYNREKKKLGNDPVRIARELDMRHGIALSEYIIPEEWVRAAVDLELPDGTDIEAGFDIAGAGSNRNAYVERCGPNIKDISAWDGTADVPGTIKYTANRAMMRKVDRVYFDGIGVGSSVTGIVTEMLGLSVDFIEIVSSNIPVNLYLDDGRRADEFFLNLKAQLWWALRSRFMKTYLYKVNNESYPADELISIPNDIVLIRQLCQPFMKYSQRGRFRCETKQEMKARGMSSPDVADACVYAFAGDIMGGKLEVSISEDERIEIETEFDPRKSIGSRVRSTSDLRVAIRDRHTSLSRNRYARRGFDDSPESDEDSVASS